MRRPKFPAAREAGDKHICTGANWYLSQGGESKFLVVVRSLFPLFGDAVYDRQEFPTMPGDNVVIVVAGFNQSPPLVPAVIKGILLDGGSVVRKGPPP